jgi:hypothetical protein
MGHDIYELFRAVQDFGPFAVVGGILGGIVGFATGDGDERWHYAALGAAVCATLGGVWGVSQ